MTVRGPLDASLLRRAVVLANADELLHCAGVFAHGTRPVEGGGPALEHEARRVFEETAQ